LIRIGDAALDRMVPYKLKKAADSGGLNRRVCKINQQGAHQQRHRPQTLV